MARRILIDFILVVYGFAAARYLFNFVKFFHFLGSLNVQNL